MPARTRTFVAADTLVLKVREGGRVADVHALIAVGVNAEGYREILGIDVTTAEDGAGWLTFWRVADRPRPVRGQAGHRRRARRTGSRDRRHPARRGLAALQNLLHDQPHGEDTQEFMALGEYLVSFGVRSTRR